MAISDLPAFGQPPAENGQTAASCRVSGRIASGRTPLPGVAVVARLGDRVVAATSTGVDGAWVLALPGERTYRLSTDLMGFAAVQRDLALDPAPCDVVLDLDLVLASRTPRAAPGAPAPGGPPAEQPAREARLARRARNAPGAAQAPGGRVPRSPPPSP